jgi:hypothetical protein
LLAPPDLAAFLLRDRVLSRIFIKRAAGVAALCLLLYLAGVLAGPAPVSGGMCRVYF